MGYRSALADYGIAVDEKLVVRYNPIRQSFDEREGPGPEVEPIIRLLESGERPTAIFAVNDLVAIDVLLTTKKLGLTVPDDLTLVGFDDIDVAAHLEVPLTTIAQSPRQMGVRAMNILAQMARGELKEIVRERLPTRLVIRKSCGGTR